MKNRVIIPKKPVAAIPAFDEIENPVNLAPKNSIIKGTTKTKKILITALKK
ncbi:MAG: hypothetical protein AABW51_01220 [Nanoarchaeota archaeon]